MTPLDAAWDWYTAVRASALALRRLGHGHWDRLSADPRLGRDNRLGGLTGDHLSGWAAVALGGLDDLAVLLLFSVFEAVVREQVRKDVSAELAAPLHPTLRAAMAEMHTAIEHGSFFRVLDPYKSVDADLTEQVNQVRHYRNWVAHGRRSKRPNAVTPEQAYARLTRMLAVVRPPV